MSMIDSFSQLIFNVYEAFTVALFMKENDNAQMRLFGHLCQQFR